MLARSTNETLGSFDPKMTAKNEVLIEDILILQKGKGCGEYNSAIAYPSINRLERIKDHIGMLAEIADTFHQKRNFKEKVLKAGKENHITRLVMHELSFYTSYSPLSIEEFSKLFKFLEHLAQTLSTNLTLVLSSIAVLTSKNCISNRVIILACGPKTKLSILEKTFFHETDPSYSGTQKKLGSLTKKVIKSKTAGGSEFYTSLSICFDLLAHTAPFTLHHKMFNHIKKTKLKSFPHTISHIVTANSIEIEDKYLSSMSTTLNSLIHADPEQENLSFRKENLPCDFMREMNNIICKWKAKYSKLDCKIDPMLKVTHPPFGPSFSINFLGAHSPDLLATPLLNLARNYNKALNTPSDLDSKDFIHSITSKEACNSFYESSLHLFRIAVKKNHCGTLKSCLDGLNQAPHVNEKEFNLFKHKLFKTVDENDMTSLHFLALMGCKQCVQLLLANEEMNPNMQDKWGNTPAHWAIVKGYIDIFKLLLEKTNLSIKNKNGETLLIAALKEKRWEIALNVLNRQLSFSQEEKELVLSNQGNLRTQKLIEMKINPTLK